MHKRLVYVPINKEIQKKIEMVEPGQGEIIEYQWENQEEFLSVFNLDLFVEINNECGSEIDDYEEAEIVERESMQKLIMVLEKFENKNGKYLIVDKLIELGEEALKRNTGVYFCF